MLVLSLISTKCWRITSPSLSSLRIIAMAPTLSLFPAILHLCLYFHPFGVQQTWPTPGSSMTVLPPPMLACKLLSLALSPTLPLLSWLKGVPPGINPSSRQQKKSRPLPNQPADDDTEMTGPTIEGEINLLLRSWTLLWIFSPSTHPPFTIDEEHYIALSQLPVTYPWPSITIDLRPYVRFWNAILSHTCSLVVAVFFLSMFQRTPFLMLGLNFCLKL